MRDDETMQALPAALSRVLGQLDQWRKAKETRRIPERLWSAATELAAEYGVHRTARALRLNYYSLKERLDAKGDPLVTSPVFVDVEPSGGGAVEGVGEGVAELADANGAMLRIEWRGASSPDLAAVTTAFFGGTS